MTTPKAALIDSSKPMSIATSAAAVRLPLRSMLIRDLSSHLRSVASALIVSACAFGLLQSCAHPLPRATIIAPCKEGVEQRPVTTECAAAAIAEHAFLNEYHDVPKYLISPMRHTETQWYFMILFGDATTPPPPGGHCMVTVERQTGKAEVTPGI
jgi:hypothetical protein